MPDKTISPPEQEQEELLEIEETFDDPVVVSRTSKVDAAATEEAIAEIMRALGYQIEQEKYG